MAGEAVRVVLLGQLLWELCALLVPTTAGSAVPCVVRGYGGLARAPLHHLPAAVPGEASLVLAAMDAGAV